MNIYKINGCDFIAAETLKDSIDFYSEEFHQFIDDDDTVELSEEQLDNFTFYYDSNSREEDDKQTSFRRRLQELIDNKEEFPLFFASTEY